MDNQHRKIKGYRDLTAEDIALMNDIKTAGDAFGELVKRVQERVKAQRVTQPAIAGEKERLDAAEPERWAAMARTDFQTGLMKLVRAVAQPGGF